MSEGALAPDRGRCRRKPRADGVCLGRGPDAEGRRDAGDGAPIRLLGLRARVRRGRRLAKDGSIGRVRRLLNEPRGTRSSTFPEWLRGRGITLLGRGGGHAGETPRASADGQPTGPMTVFHLFDSPLRALSRPYESVTWAASTVPHRAWRRPAEKHLRAARLPPRRARQVTDGDRSGGTPGIRREQHPRVDAARQERVPSPWGGSGRSGRKGRRPISNRGRLEEARRASPSSRIPGRYAPTFSRRQAGRTAPEPPHVLSCAMAMRRPPRRCRRRGLSDVLDVHSTMSLFSPTFELPVDAEGRLMQLDPSAPDFAERLKTLNRRPADIGRRGKCAAYGAAIREGGGLEHAARQAGAAAPTTFLPEKRAGRCSRASATCAREPLTRARPASPQVGDRTYRVEHAGWRRGRPRAGSPSRCGSWRASRRRAKVFSPLLVRFPLGRRSHHAAGGRSPTPGGIRNELQGR